MGGFPTRATAVLSFRLLPPLHMQPKTQNTLQHNTYVRQKLLRHKRIYDMLHRHPIPVSATAFVGMLAEVQPSDFSFHHLFDLALWNPSEAGKHCQEFTASQTFNQGIKLARSQGTTNNMRLLCPGTQYVNFNHSKTLENFSAQKIASITTS